MNTIKQYNGPIKWIHTNTAFLTLHGSRCYGTNKENSDYDYKGFCIPPKEYFISATKKFEQTEQRQPCDLVIYNINKFIKLAMDANPNILEILFTEESDHIYKNKIAEKILDNKELFVTKKTRFTFGGYAISQLNRIKTHRRWLLNPPTHCPTKKEFGLYEHGEISKNQLDAALSSINKKIDEWNLNFLDYLDEDVKISIINKFKECLTDINIFTKEDLWIPAAKCLNFNENFIEILKKEKQYQSKKNDWDQYQHWIKTRNKERAELESKYHYDVKNGYHLVRLLKMSKEILETGKVIVKRPDADELLDIRNGAWTYEKLIDWAENINKEIERLYDTTNIIPAQPNKDKIDKLCEEVIEEFLFN